VTFISGGRLVSVGSLSTICRSNVASAAELTNS
jgi:hypothetical protein